MRRLVLILLVVFLLAGMAAAQIPTSGNVYFGYSYYNTNLTGNRGSLNGWEGSLEGKVFPFIGIVADFSGDYGSLDFPTPVGTINASAHIENVLFGPRVSVPIGKFRPFGEGMIGVAHANTNGFGSDTSFSAALGGGLDYRLLRFLAWRFEGDYIRTSLFNGTQHNARISTGIAVHF
jgi:opacity protein-like surface antigen